mmetsp:Transcript_29581/g.54158  ORF Transcript_29581/g.54158 Transcript_29581/m.54158 type:complete len:505 (+) Transcript_29581:253-1767(+)
MHGICFPLTIHLLIALHLLKLLLLQMLRLNKLLLLLDLLLMVQLPHQDLLRLLPPLLQSRHHRRDQPLARPALVIALTYPHLTDVLDIHRRQRRMEGHLVQQAIQRGGKEDQRHAATGLHLDVQIGKRRRPAPRHVVEVDQHRHRPLPAVRGEPPPVLVAEIERVEVLQVLLGGHVPSHLGQLAVLRGLPGEQSDLAEVLRQVLPGEVAGAGGAAGTDLAAPLPHDGGWAEGVVGVLDEEVALGGGEEVFDGEYGGMGVQELRPGVVGVDPVVDGRDEGTVLDGEGGYLGPPRRRNRGHVMRDGELGCEAMMMLMMLHGRDGHRNEGRDRFATGRRQRRQRRRGAGNGADERTRRPQQRCRGVRRGGRRHHHGRRALCEHRRRPTQRSGHHRRLLRPRRTQSSRGLLLRGGHRADAQGGGLRRRLLLRQHPLLHLNLRHRRGRRVVARRRLQADRHRGSGNDVHRDLTGERRRAELEGIERARHELGLLLVLRHQRAFEELLRH